MAGIPETQLATWANLPDSATAARTGQAIRDCLKGPKSLVLGRNFAIYLQGSYKNSTNIRGDSDVDVVVQLRETFGFNILNLDSLQTTAFHAKYPTASYNLAQFRTDVQNTLVATFGTLVESHNKCIQVKKRPNFVDADVVPCITYKVFGNQLTSEPLEGIQFYTVKENRSIVNFPRQHYQEGIAKHAATHVMYKPSVRIFKNLRNSMEAKGLIQSGPASYFVECLIFNVPNDRFAASYSTTTANILNWLHEEYKRTGYAKFVRANGFMSLFDASVDTWDAASAYAFVVAAIKAWNAW